MYAAKNCIHMGIHLHTYRITNIIQPGAADTTTSHWLFYNFNTAWNIHGLEIIINKILDNTWNITRNIMILYHEVFMYFLLRLGKGRGEGGGEGSGGEGGTQITTFKHTKPLLTTHNHFNHIKPLPTN